MKNKEKKEKGMKIDSAAAVLKGVGAAFLITLVVFVVYALLLTYTDVSEGYISVVAIVSTAVSCCVGGFLAAKKGGKSGLIYGVLVGVVYGILLIAVNILAGAEGGSILSKVTMMVCAMASGGVGGIVGVNK